jgi:NAD(P) transhydrogenase
MSSFKLKFPICMRPGTLSGFRHLRGPPWNKGLGRKSHVGDPLRAQAGTFSLRDLHHSVDLHGRPAEETLTANRVPYKMGIAKYSAFAKSMMLGDEAGMLKTLFDRHTRKLLGVHA